MSVLKILFVPILALSAAPAAGAQISALGQLELPFGEARAKVTTVLQMRVENELRVRVRATSDPVERGRIADERQTMLDTLAAGHVETTRDRAKYALAPIAPLVAIGPGAGVTRETTAKRERWLLYFRDRLYGAAITLPASAGFPEQVSEFSAKLGKPTAFLRKSAGKGDVVGVEWRKDGETILLRDVSTDYGVRVLARLDNALWDEAKAATAANAKATEPSDKDSAEALLDEFIRP